METRMGWFTKKPKAIGEKEKDKIAEGVMEAVSKLGDIMERDSFAIYDTSELPLPKPEMKLALKIAWSAAPNGYVRSATERAFVFLSNFQDGVGSTPIESHEAVILKLGELKATDDKANDTAKIDSAAKAIAAAGERWKPWEEKALKEASALALELKQFKQHAKNEPATPNVADDQLTERPVTRALLSRATHLMDETAIQELGRVRPLQEPATLEERINSAVPIIVLEIAKDAMDASGVSWLELAGGLPGEPLPREAHLVLAFALLVTTEILGLLQNEAYPLAFQNFPLTSIANTLFCMRSTEQNTKLYQLARGVALQVMQ